MFTALLDTNVLWPSLQRDFFLSLAVEGTFRPVWSEAILSELSASEENKLIARHQKTPREAHARAFKLVDTMRRMFPDALIQNWEWRDGSYGLPDRNDEHVVAAAETADAKAIVTENLKDFPAHLIPSTIAVVSARTFAFHAVSVSTHRAHLAINEIAKRSGSRGPVMTHDHILDRLEKAYGFTDAVGVLRDTRPAP
ncbi:PIN domain-containing protein [Mycetocola tolaasinivorans]|uniref:PIN domain-containing protein n=1 Tax=Mycetocola tolaasinivorans TaxID=76635 RepID=A0A3L7AD69_9MICO|nr:PIN domain-containing protein [Mycetocola tolaasinivorans]RLP77924.1 PIN domain-containing protein [Mycetocola tolaasinivorans]